MEMQLICIYDEIPMWKRDYGGNTIKYKEVMKFQWERGKYSTALNIQKPIVNPQFWEEKNVSAK